MAPLKVLRVIGGLDPVFGGPSVSATNSVLAAQRQGIETHFVFPGRDPEAELRQPGARRLARAGVNVRCFPHIRWLRRASRSMGISTQLARWVWHHAKEYDVIHAHSAWVLPSVVAVLSGLRAGRSVVLTPHEGLTAFDIARSRSWLLRWLKVWLRGFYERNVDAIVFSSRLELRDSTTGRNSGRGVVVYHPVFAEHDELEGGRSARSPRKSGVLRLAFLGRLVPKKNLNRLIEALAELPKSVSLRVAGEGTAQYIADLKGLADACGVADRIRWHGFMSGAAKTRLFGDTDLLVMPSEYECFGMAAAEAMCAGTPVLVSPDTGVAEIVEQYDAGLVVRPTVSGDFERGRGRLQDYN